MARRTTAAAALLALGTLAACAAPDAIAPDAAAPGALAGINLAEASAEGDLPVLKSAHSNKVEPEHLDRGRFNIAFKYVVDVTPAQRAVFEAARQRWERIIIADVPSVQGTIPSAFAGLPPVSTTVVDDVIIEVALVYIDGPGTNGRNVLGSAGPRYIRTSDGLTISGVMYFDTYDLAFLEERGLFDEVIVHEMGHVLGVGSLWNINIPNVFSRTLRVGQPSEYQFVGKSANVHWADAGGTGMLPIANVGAVGSIGSHWRESVLRNELMTPSLNLGENPLSRITAASLRDMGYGVAITAEDYTLPVTTTTTAPSSASSASDVNIAESEDMLTPVGVVLPAP